MEINGQYQKLMLVLLLDGSGEQKRIRLKVLLI